MKKISIIIPVYNIEKYIVYCLKSVDKQLNDQAEVILIDDGSTDTSKDRINKFINGKEGYYYIHQKNRGLSGARNRGINAAKGKYLLFLDGDDYLEDYALETIIKYIENENYDLILNRYAEIDELSNIKSENASIENIYFDDPIQFYDKYVNRRKKWISAWCCVVKREFIIKNNLFFKEGILHEDELWVPLVFLHAKRIGIQNKVIYDYRVNRLGSIMQVQNVKRELDKIAVCRELYLLIDDKNKKVLNRRIRDIMTAVLLSTAEYKNFEDQEIIAQSFEKNKRLLLNIHGINIYFLYSILRFQGCMNIIMSIRKLQYILGRKK